MSIYIFTWRFPGSFSWASWSSICASTTLPIASIVTISTPHHGSAISDLVAELVSDPNSQAILDALVNVIGAVIYDAQGNGTSVFTALFELIFVRSFAIPERACAPIT